MVLEGKQKKVYGPISRLYLYVKNILKNLVQQIFKGKRFLTKNDLLEQLHQINGGGINNILDIQNLLNVQSEEFQLEFSAEFSKIVSEIELIRMKECLVKIENIIDFDEEISDYIKDSLRKGKLEKSMHTIFFNSINFNLGFPKINKILIHNLKTSVNFFSAKGWIPLANFGNINLIILSARSGNFKQIFLSLEQLLANIEFITSDEHMLYSKLFVRFTSILRDERIKLDETILFKSKFDVENGKYLIKLETQLINEFSMKNIQIKFTDSSILISDQLRIAHKTCSCLIPDTIVIYIFIYIYYIYIYIYK